jgi:hypothetical protein
MARMSERQASRQISENSGGSSYQYESSYMKKIHNNPAPSVAKSLSLTSKSGIQQNTSIQSSPVLSDRSRIPRGNSNQQQVMHENRAPSVTKSSSFGSKSGIQPNKKLQSPPTVPVADRIRMQLKGHPMIRTNSHQMENVLSPSLVGQPPSPAQTIDAILCEQSNGQDNTSRDRNPKRSQSPYNYTQISHRLQRRSPSRSPARSPSPTRSSRGRSPERAPSLSRPSIYSSSDEKPESRFNSMSMNGRSVSSRSIRSRRSRSISPVRQMQHNSSSYRNSSIARVMSASKDSTSMSARKLPHETRYDSSPNSRKYRSSTSYKAPFWTQVSVTVSSALLKAGKDKKYAEAAQIAIVQAGEDQYETDQTALNFVASKASLAVIEAGGDANTAAIATVACLKANDNTPSTEEQIKIEIDKTVAEIKNRASLVAQTTYDGGAKAVSAISSFASKGYEDLKSFSETSFRKYRVYQQNYISDRQNYMLARQNASRRSKKDRDRGYSRRYRDSRDDDTLSDEDRYRSRRGGTPRSSSRHRRRYESDDSSDYHRQRRRSHRKSRRNKSSDSRSFSSASGSSFSSRTGSSVSSSESSDGKGRKSSKSGSSKSEKLKSKYSKSSSYSSR